MTGSVYLERVAVEHPGRSTLSWYGVIRNSENITGAIYLERVAVEHPGRLRHRALAKRLEPQPPPADRVAPRRVVPRRAGLYGTIVM